MTTSLTSYPARHCCFFAANAFCGMIVAIVTIVGSYAAVLIVGSFYDFNRREVILTTSSVVLVYFMERMLLSHYVAHRDMRHCDDALDTSAVSGFCSGEATIVGVCFLSASGTIASIVIAGVVGAILPRFFSPRYGTANEV